MKNFSNTPKVRLLQFLYSHGGQRFTDLTNNSDLNLSRGTLSKYIKECRDSYLITVKFENSKKFNVITQKGIAYIDEFLTESEIGYRISQIGKKETQFLIYRDELILRFGRIEPPQLFVDTVEILDQMENVNYLVNLPNQDLQYFIAFYIARYGLRFCQPDFWWRENGYSEEMLIPQSRFCDVYEIDKIDLIYHVKQWCTQQKYGILSDDQGNQWFLSPERFNIETTVYRWMKDAILEEILTENCKIDLYDESYKMLKQFRNNYFFLLDNSLFRGIYALFYEVFIRFVKIRAQGNARWQNILDRHQELEEDKIHSYMVELHKETLEKLRRSGVLSENEM